jgi:hypothetical protein
MANKEKSESHSKLIDARIEELPDWRGNVLSRIRRLIKRADPEVVEEVKWRKPSNSMLGVPVWSHDGIICTGETYKDKVKITFAKGAHLEDPVGLFNSSLGGSTRRAIDIREGDEIDENAFKALVRAAAALNASSAPAKPEGTTGNSDRSTATQGKRSLRGSEAEAPSRRQPSNSEGRRRRPRAGLHRRHARLETGRRAPPRRAHRAHHPPRPQGREVELALLWGRGPGMVPQLPLLHEVRQGDLLLRHITPPGPPSRVKTRGRALLPYPRRRAARRGACDELD